MCCNLPLFGVVMSGFSAAALLAVGVHRETDAPALGCFLAVFVSMIMLIQFDIEQHHFIHMALLAMLLATVTAFVIVVDLKPNVMLIVYFVATALFLFIMLLNFVYTDWLPPFMTLQALAEILWLDVMIVYVVSDN